MPLARLPASFDHPDWLFELKYDGFRALAYIEAGRVRLVSRKENTYKSFAGLCASIAEELGNREAVLDGEIVYLDDAGLPRFYELLRRRGPQRFAAFDVLWLDGRDLRGLPLISRKAMLRELLPAQSRTLLYCDHVESKGTALYNVACRMGPGRNRSKANERPVHSQRDYLGEDQESGVFTGGGPAGVV